MHCCRPGHGSQAAGLRCGRTDCPLRLVARRHPESPHALVLRCRYVACLLDLGVSRVDGTSAAGARGLGVSVPRPRQVRQVRGRHSLHFRYMSRSIGRLSGSSTCDSDERKRLMHVEQAANAGTFRTQNAKRVGISYWIWTWWWLAVSRPHWVAPSGHELHAMPMPRRRAGCLPIGVLKCVALEALGSDQATPRLLQGVVVCFKAYVASTIPISLQLTSFIGLRIGRGSSESQVRQDARRIAIDNDPTRGTVEHEK